MKRLKKAAIVAALVFGWIIGILAVLAGVLLLGLIFLAKMENPSWGFFLLALVFALIAFPPRDFLATVREAIKVFLEMKDDESLISVQGAKKASIIASGRVAYNILDYLIAGGLGVLVVQMNIRGFYKEEIFLATWVYDLIAALGFYYLSDLSGKDITLGKSLRRSADVMFKGGIIWTILGVSWLLIHSFKAIVWEGPETICFLFKKELNTAVRFWVVIIFLSAVQGVFGAWLYTTGYKIWVSIF